MAKKNKKNNKHVIVCNVAIKYKCGGCNHERSVAYYFKGDKKPEIDEKDKGRLKNGCCASCFIEIIEAGGYKILTPTE
jgi:hypothetical protein